MEADNIKHVEMKEKNEKDYLRRNLLETKLYSKNLIKGIITRAVFLVRYLGLFLKWTGEELPRIDKRTRRLRIKQKALHPRGDTDSYVSRKEVGRVYTIIQDSVDASIQ